MQIKNIVLYKDSDTDPRVLDFNIGKLNIITGDSSTGKTAIIDIVNYCLGSKSFNVKGDKIRDNVRWFAITIQLEDTQFFVARENPTFLSSDSTSNLFFLCEDNIEIPPFSELIENSNTTALNKFISNKLHFNDNLHVEENNTRDSLEATFRHSKIFSFQPQDVIAQYKYIFFTQDEAFIPQAIKDTFPYILGAIREDELLIQQEISKKRRKLNKYLREKKLDEAIKAQSIKQLSLLVEESKNLELIDKNFIFNSDEEAIEELKKVQNLDIKGNNPLGENEQLSKLIEAKGILRKKLTKVQNEINSVEDFSDNSKVFSNEASSQFERLLSIGLYKEPKTKEYWNSLVGLEADNILPSIEAINLSLIDLQDSLKFTEFEKPKINKLLVELEKNKSDIESEINSLNENINIIYKQNEELEKLKNINIQKGKVLGKISLFLDSYNNSSSDSNLSEKITTLENEIKDLEDSISKEQKENRINAILNKINILMSNWSDELEWEYKNFNLRFDIKKLTVFADSDEKSESLQQMGSGENWLACHLLVHLALHKHFIDKKRPVANFIIFDQPTQVHYPSGYMDENGVKLKSDDELADEKMFNFIYKIVEKLSPDLQVIITDHANFNNNYFQESIIEEWRGGNKLVPLDWINTKTEAI